MVSVPLTTIVEYDHFEAAFAGTITSSSLGSGTTLATVVDVFIEVPVMPVTAKVCVSSQRWFGKCTWAKQAGVHNPVSHGQLR